MQKASTRARSETKEDKNFQQNNTKNSQNMLWTQRLGGQPSPPPQKKHQSMQSTTLSIHRQRERATWTQEPKAKETNNKDTLNKTNTPKQSKRTQRKQKERKGSKEETATKRQRESERERERETHQITQLNTMCHGLFYLWWFISQG